MAENNDKHGRRDPYLGQNADVYYQLTKPLLKLRGMRDLALRGALQEINIAIAAEGGPLPADELTLSRTLRMDIRTLRPLIATLQSLNLIWLHDGRWMAKGAALEFERRAKRRDKPRHSVETANDNNEGAKPPPSSSLSPKGSFSKLLPHAEPRAQGLQWVSAEMLGLLTEHVGEHRAKVLQHEFEAWPKAYEARDPDAAFCGFLRKRGIFISPKAIATARAAQTRAVQ